MDILGMILKWFSSGPVGIFGGLFGGIVLYFVYKKIAAYVAEQKFKNDVTSNASSTGQDSSTLSQEVKADSDWLQAQKEIDDKILGGLKAGDSSLIVAPDKVKAKEKFDVSVRGFNRHDMPLYADKQYVLGALYYQADKDVMFLSGVSLSSTGKRTLDVKSDDGSWISRDILVE